MTDKTRLHLRSLRNTLLIGASIGSLVLTGAALAQNARVFGGRGGSADPATAAARAAQAAAANAARTSSASSRAVAAFRRAAQTRTAMRDAQVAARAAAQAAQSLVPNGIGKGALQAAEGIEWIGANGPVQSDGTGGRTNVTIDQTGQKAILSWDSFNVGRETDLLFKQGGTDWVALNRVTDASADPTRILGSIKAAGSVYIINRNGVIFGGASSVNTRNLIAASADITNDQFLNRGIYSQLASGRYTPVFTRAGGAVSVEAGAQITTATPTSVTAGGGFVLLMGSSVTNAGAISTPRGQAALSAGDDFIVRRGFGTEENPYSTTRGNEVRGLINAGSASGRVTNTGQIEAALGDITLAGRTIRQDGVAVATTGVNQRGTIHLLNSASDAGGSVTLGKDSLTLILPDLDAKDTALNGQRDALIAQSEIANGQRASTTTGGFDDRALLADRLDQSRVEIVTGGSVRFEGGSQTIANGGQVAVQASAGRITVASGASIDVSGVMGVALDMAANSIQVNVQGNELRDSPANRDETGLKSQNVWIDVRDLVLLPSGTGGYEGDRWYTPGGLLEVGGYLSNMDHGIGEWAAVGGTITLSAKEVVADKGAIFDISGGSLDYAAGYVRSTRVMGADGKLYDIRNAPAHLKYIGVGNAFSRRHDRWGEQYTQVWSNPLFSRGNSMRWEEGYSVGRDAGRLILSAPTVVMEADILADAINGERQVNARADGVSDGYKLGQHTVARNGALSIGKYDNLGRTDLFASDVRIGAITPLETPLATTDAIPEDRTGTVWLDAAHLSAQNLGEVQIGTRSSIAITANLTLANGGRLDLTAPTTNIAANISAKSGTLVATNVFTSVTNGASSLVIDGKSSIVLREGAVLDVRGGWSNLLGSAGDAGGLARMDGGTISLQSTQDVELQAGSRIDVSSGAAMLADGTFRGGKGGSVNLASNLFGGSGTSQLTLGADIRGHGVQGGGNLTLLATAVTIGGKPSAEAGSTQIGADFFNKGFSSYRIATVGNLTVAEGAVVDVTMPVYRASSASAGMATGADPAAALELWTPPTYQADQNAGVMIQRGGASLSLRAGGTQARGVDLDTTTLNIGKGAAITVDPGQSIDLVGIGQMTIDGRLNAWGGAIRIRTGDIEQREIDESALLGHDRSIWIGENAVLDVAARAVSAVDDRGRSYGTVTRGGSIVIGAELDTALGEAPGKQAMTHNFVVIREGAVLDASVTSATLDLAGRGSQVVASDGGLISVTSNNGLYLDGTMRARSGGAGALGGTLNIALESPQYYNRAVSRVLDPRVLVLAQTQGLSELAPDVTAHQAGTLTYGHGRIGVDAISAGGFGNLNLLSMGSIALDGDVNLRLNGHLGLYSGGLSLGETAGAQTRLSAATVRLAGAAHSVVRDQMVSAKGKPAPEQLSGATITVTGDLVDLRDGVTFGTNSFDHVTLDSRGDLRFLAPVQGSGFTTLVSDHDVTLRAAQLYPTTMAKGRILVGAIARGYDPETTLRIEGTGGPAPAVPYSLFGSLLVEAATIEQAGVVRAPLGNLQIGMSGYYPTGTVSLLPGSVTSVSANGLQMPFGGTVDGLTYSYDGKNVTLMGVGGITGGAFSATMQVGLTLGGQKIAVDPGAILDLSGGGDLTGAGFISGRGGSVDVLRTALANVNPGFGFSDSDSAVYAVVPNFAGGYAPDGGDLGAGLPELGRQITVAGTIPGLPAGTYTLLPSTYATLPGAFRVEIAAAGNAQMAMGATALPGGSWMAGATLGMANSGVREAMARQVIVTPSKTVRDYSLYNQTSYADFVIADAVRQGIPRGLLPADTRSLLLDLARGAGADSVRFGGKALFAPAEGGFGGTVMIAPITGPGESMEVVAAGSAATAGFAGVSVDAGELAAMGATRLVLGGMQYINYGQGGRLVDIYDNTKFLHVRSGVVLAAPEVFLAATYRRSDTQATGIYIEQGARINTLGQGEVAYDSTDGYAYATAGNKVFVSNGVLNLIPASAAKQDRSDSGIWIGTCPTSTCTGDTEIYSEGTIALSTGNEFQLDDGVRYGTRNLTLSVGRFNVGDAAALAQAESTNVLAQGLTLNQAVLDRLLRGDTRYGAPALQTLTLTAAASFDFYGSATLDTIDPGTGKSSLANLVLSTPAIYGMGGASDVATIRTGNLIWKGSTQAPAAIVAGGAGTGTGKFVIEATRIELGYGPETQPSAQGIDDRLILGFSDVALTASDRITSNMKSTLSVHQSQGAYQPGKGYAYSGGNLTITAPLVTGESGSTNVITVGGDLRIAGGGASRTVGSDALGANLAFRARSIALDSSVVLPSGTLTLDAEQDVTLTGQSRIDVSGREIAFNDLKKYSWGGDVRLESRAGNVRQAAGSIIDLSAANNDAGRLAVIALAAGAGTADLQGEIRGSASGQHDAGGTLVPYLGGQVDIRVQTLPDFAALNDRLNTGGVFGARAFQLKQGNLTIGNGVRASTVSISIDGGALTVEGLIDASGPAVGTISLAARDGLTLTGGAVLDAHGTVLRVDSYGKIIDSPNRAIVSLNSGQGRLTLASGARIDLRHGTGAVAGTLPGQQDGRDRGTLDLNAPRLGGNDIDIDARGAITIQGARTISVNAGRAYDDAAYGTSPAASGKPYQVIDQAYIDAKFRDSTAFIDAALLNQDLVGGKLGGLNTAAYRNAFHIRPAVEIVSATPDGDLVVQGDLDLSGHRYASLNPNSPRTGIYGSGEAGTLTLRAGGDLNIYGSINDGFAPPPPTQDDNGWLLLPGVDFTGGDIIVPRGGVVIADGTRFAGLKPLNYDLPMRAQNFTAGLVIPVDSTLAAPFMLLAGTVLPAEIRDTAGTLLFAKGAIVPESQTLPAGTRFGAGMRLSSAARLEAMVWPKGIPLPEGATLAGSLTLPLGALLPANTDVKLGEGVTSVDLRPSIDSRQGALWALAPMLPEGSQSSSLVLVAGADTTAANPLALNPWATSGNLLLADSHYTSFNKLLPSKSKFAWTQEAADVIGVAFGQEITDQEAFDLSGGAYETVAQLCLDNPSFCQVKASYVWTQEGSENFYGDGSMTGKPIDFVEIAYPDLCFDAPEFCQSLDTPEYGLNPAGVAFSVVRTGAADLTLLAAGDLRLSSLFGVYTAGTSSQATSANDPYNLPRVRTATGKVLKDHVNEKFVDGGPDSLARAWYPTDGGNLTVRVGGNLAGEILTPSVYGGPSRPEENNSGFDSAATGNWLWRQGTGSALGGGKDQQTAWWINFGSFINKGTDQLVGFTGLGTLGGGNLDIDVGGDAGILTMPTIAAQSNNQRTDGLVLAVAGTGRVGTDGTLTLTGGGDLNLRVGGRLNPGSIDSEINNGGVANLRGQAQLRAGSMGAIVLSYFDGAGGNTQTPGETRPFDPFTPTLSSSRGGLTLTPGDAVFNLDTPRDLAVAGAEDPGRTDTAIRNAFAWGDGTATGVSWFTLWTDHTAINLFSGGGNVTPINPLFKKRASDMAWLYPSIFSAVAANGSIYYGYAGRPFNPNDISLTPILLAPSVNSKLEILAGDSIYSGGFMIGQSGVSRQTMATPLRPAFQGLLPGQFTGVGNVSSTATPASIDGGSLPMFAFGPATYSSEWDASQQIARFYAVKGDLIGVNTGRIVRFDANDRLRAGQVWYQGARPAWMMAGRDIVSSGNALGKPDVVYDYFNGISYETTSNLFVHGSQTDISIVKAGRDILYGGFNVGGPGSLEITAGRNIVMDDKVGVVSIGPVATGDSRPGAGVTLFAGAGPEGQDFAGIVDRYLDESNLADPARPLAGQNGKVARTYHKELGEWLADRFGFSRSAAEAATFFKALPAEQQRVFLRTVYFAELREGGREYNDPASARFASYLRGREMIAAVFPDKDAAGQTIERKGDIIMFGGAGVRTNFGGDIEMLAPGGQIVVGVQGAVPPSTAGVVTQGQGDIRLFSESSLLLGLSRIMTTFGGSILSWSEEGDINAGRGAKSTIVFTPPRRAYDTYGNVALSPVTPSSGAGIATLNPIPEVAPGDIDLIAPLGTIDAGEAGIRVSGNINLAALQVINAANIQVQGDAQGIPLPPVVNTGALTAASAASTAVVAQATRVAQQGRSPMANNIPVVFTVRLLGFGE